MQQLLVLVVCVALSAAKELVSTGPSPCKDGIKVDPAFSLRAFASKNQGTWPYTKATLGTQSNDFTWMFAVVEPTNIADEYSRKVYYQAKNGTSGIFHNVLDREGSNGGPLVSKYNNVEAKTYFVKFGDGLAYYYICNDQGVNSGVDFRYALSHGPLTAEQEKIIQDIDKEYNFNGELKSFHIPL